MGPNVWPPSGVLAESAFREPVEAYYKAVYELSFVVLDILKRTLPYRPHIFHNLRANSPLAPLRLSRRSPTQGTEGCQLGVGEHANWSVIALLLQDANEGLEVLDEDKDEWVPIESLSGSFIVSVGEIFSKWMKGVYKSSLHRVVSRSLSDRYSAKILLWR